MEATTKDLRLHTKALLSATDRGEEVIITYRGKRRVKLVALEEEQAPQTSNHQRNPAFGLWQDDTSAGQSIGDYVRSLRQPRELP